MIDGDKLWRYQGLGRIAQYTVTGIMQRADLTLYEVECGNCNHGWKCRILITEYAKTESYEYAAMVNDQDGEQDCWHRTHGADSRYYTTKIDCLKAVYTQRLRDAEQEKITRERGVEATDKKIAEIKEQLQNLLTATEATA